MKIKKTPEEIIIKIPGNINESDFIELVSFIRNKISRSNLYPGHASSDNKSHYNEQNWWKENQLLL